MLGALVRMCTDRPGRGRCALCRMLSRSRSSLPEVLRFSLLMLFMMRPKLTGKLVKKWVSLAE